MSFLAVGTIALAVVPIGTLARPLAAHHRFSISSPLSKPSFGVIRRKRVTVGASDLSTSTTDTTASGSVRKKGNGNSEGEDDQDDLTLRGQLGILARDAMIKRTYVTDIAGFAEAETEEGSLRENVLKKKSFSDDTDFTRGSDVFDYISFAPSVRDVQMSELVDSITGEFSPVMDVLFALIASDTISRLSQRQEKIQEAVIEELAYLKDLTASLIGMLPSEMIMITTQNKQKNSSRSTMREKETLMALLSIWRYTNTLIFGTRNGELENLLEDDPLDSISSHIHKLKAFDMSASMLDGGGDGENNVNQTYNAYSAHQQQHQFATLLHYNNLENVVTNIQMARMRRLDKEGESIPSAVYTMMDTLSMYILFSYILLATSHGAEPIMYAHQSGNINYWFDIVLDSLEEVFRTFPRFGLDAEGTLFAVLLSWLLVVKNLVQDLKEPFVGNAHIRRMMSTNIIYGIRRDIEYCNYLLALFFCLRITAFKKSGKEGLVQRTKKITISRANLIRKYFTSRVTTLVTIADRGSKFGGGC
eukprot:jgi/Bigna1/147111/aug1.129_g21819